MTTNTKHRSNELVMNTLNHTNDRIKKAEKLYEFEAFTCHEHSSVSYHLPLTRSSHKSSVLGKSLNMCQFNK